MRRIMTREERGRKERRNKTILGVILIGVMILSTAGYSFYRTEDKEKPTKYKEIEFILGEDNLWYFQFQEQEFSTVYFPKETENISVPVTVSLQNYIGKPLYFSYDSNKESVSEIARNIARFSQRAQFACTEECEEDLPVKNCSDNMIIIKEIEEINETLIKQEENCIYILAKENEIIKVSDAFIFKLLGLN